MILKIVWHMLKLAALVTISAGITNSVRVHSNDLFAGLYMAAQSLFSGIFGSKPQPAQMAA